MLTRAAVVKVVDGGVEVELVRPSPALAPPQMIRTCIDAWRTGAPGCRRLSTLTLAFRRRFRYRAARLPRAEESA